MKKNHRSFAGNVLFTLSIFIIFLLAFGNKIVVPVWLQPAGRLHPMLLHFPIVILLAGVALDFIYGNKDPASDNALGRLAAGIFLIGSLAAGITVITGLLLSNEAGYEGSLLQWHKWTSAGIFFLSYFIYLARGSKWYRSALARAVSIVTFTCILVAGHYGATLTHGEDFVLAPISTPEKVSMEEAILFEHVIKPVFAEKCNSCHNPEKRKGNLDLTDTLSIRKGGKSGPLFTSTNLDQGLLMKRLYLPVENKKHMPPVGKEQLSDEELSLFHYWAKSNTPFNTKVMDLPVGDSLAIAARSVLQQLGNTEESFSFPAASENTIASLNNNYRFVVPASKGSPALFVNFYGRSNYTPEALTELRSVKQQIISLNLDKMPVKDDDLKVIGEFENLQTLNLNFTDIHGRGLQYLKPLQHLSSLSLAGSKVNYAGLQQIIGMKSLASITLWNTDLSEQDIAKLQAARPQIEFVKGFDETASEPLKLNMPQLGNASSVFSESLDVELVHPVKGVTIQYSLGETDPDSSSAPVYQDKIPVHKNNIIKAFASKKGWLNSDVASFEFYKRSYKPDTLISLNPPFERFTASGAATLLDGQLGTLNFFSNKWLGASDKNMELVMEFKEPVPVQSAGLHVMYHTSIGAFPPASIEVWGGDNKDILRLLARSTPEQPGPKAKPYLKTVNCSFQKRSVRYMKIIATPFQKPSSDGGKPKRTLLLVDEIFIN